MATGFHPDKSRVDAHTLADFLRAPLTGRLSEVPGIGPATEKALRAHGVSTTYGLLGKYLALKEDGVESAEHADRFWYWLSSVGAPAGFRAGVVLSVAEKVNAAFPGVYADDVYARADP